MNVFAETPRYRGNSVITEEPPKALQLWATENLAFAHPFYVQFSAKVVDDRLLFRVIPNVHDIILANQHVALEVRLKRGAEKWRVGQVAFADPLAGRILESQVAIDLDPAENTEFGIRRDREFRECEQRHGRVLAHAARGYTVVVEAEADVLVATSEDELPTGRISPTQLQSGPAAGCESTSSLQRQAVGDFPVDYEDRENTRIIFKF